MFRFLNVWMAFLGLVCLTDSTSAAEPMTAAATATGEDWASFLGPNGYGISSETGLLATWPTAGPPQVWQKEIGTGYSAPSVCGDKLVIFHRVQEEELVECLQAQTGESLWKYAAPSTFSDPYGYNNGPRCSPILTETRCYTFGAEGRLLCLDLATGKKIWERETQKDFQVPTAFFGVGATPILEDNRLIVLVGGQPNAGVVAFDVETGKTLWENIGQKTWDGVETGWPAPKTYTWTGEEMNVSYSSPIAATIHGQRHILCLMRQGLVSVDPETGKENFHYWFRSRDHESVNAARPVVLGDTILLTAAYRTGGALLKVAADGKSVQEVWRNPRNLSAHWSTPIPVGDYVYGFDGRHENEGNFRCVEIATGTVIWETSGWTKGTAHLTAATRSSVLNTETNQIEPWPYYGRGSAIYADGKWIILGERGTVALAKADEAGFEELSRFKPDLMNYPCWAAPVLSHGLMYLRCENGLVCYNLKAQPQ